jgi:hypothetical protein
MEFKCNFDKTKIMIFKKPGKLIYVRSKIGGSKIVYLFWGKARKFRSLVETQRKYKSERHTH